MKIPHLITWLAPGGIEKWLHTMLGVVNRDLFQMDFCCKGPLPVPLANVAIAHGAKVQHCRLQFDHLRYGFRLKRIITDGKDDIIHNHLEVYSGLPVWVARQIGIPIITSYHNTKFSARTWIRNLGFRHLRVLYAQVSVRYAFRYSEHTTGCSQGVLEHLPGNYGSKSSVIYYGADVSQKADPLLRLAFREGLGWPVDARLILHVGNYTRVYLVWSDSLSNALCTYYDFAKTWSTGDCNHETDCYA